MMDKKCTPCFFRQALESLKKEEPKYAFREYSREYGYNVTVTYHIVPEEVAKVKRAAIAKILVEHVLQRIKVENGDTVYIKE